MAGEKKELERLSRGSKMIRMVKCSGKRRKRELMNVWSFPTKWPRDR